MILERHYGKVNNLQLEFSERNQARFNKALRQLEGQEFELLIRKIQRHATNSQYSYYRKGIVRTCLTTEMFGGYTEDEVALFFEQGFLSETKIKKAGKEFWEYKVTRDVANLSSAEMSKFIEQILVWLADNDISIGSPEDYFL